MRFYCGPGSFIKWDVYIISMVTFLLITFRSENCREPSPVGVVSIQSGRCSELNLCGISPSETASCISSIPQSASVLAADSTLPPQLDGFPIIFPQGNFREVHPVDLNNDGFKELVFFLDRPTSVQCFDHKGKKVDGWAIQKEINTENEIPVFYDVNGDGYQEVILTGRFMNRPEYFDIYSFDRNGQQLGGWNLNSNSMNYHIESNLTLLDVDLKDKGREIIAPFANFDSLSLRAFPSETGQRSSVLHKIPHQSQYFWSRVSQLCGGDIDNDGVPEIAGIYSEESGARHERYVFMLDLNGGSNNNNNVSSNGDLNGELKSQVGNKFWLKKVMPNDFPGIPVIGDINNDGKSEIVVGASGLDSLRNFAGSISVFSQEGLLLKSWRADSWNITLALADLDGDKNLEIICGSSDGIAVFRNDGQRYKNWPNDILLTGQVSSAGVPLIAGDIDGDNVPEIIMGKANKLYAWKEDARPLPGFPFTDTLSGVFNSVLLTDLDGDGDVDLLAGNYHKLYAFDFSAKYNENNMPWPMKRHDIHATSMYGYKDLTGVDDIGNDKDKGNTILRNFILHQNYPNPFNPATTISFSLPEDGYVRLVVYNMLGQVEKILVDGFMKKGEQRVKWNAAANVSGVYVARLEFGGNIKNVKMMAIK